MKKKNYINKRLIKYGLYSINPKKLNNKAYIENNYKVLLANYLWNETHNLELVTKVLVKYSKNRIFSTIKSSLANLIPIYEKEYDLDINGSERFRILKFEREPRICPYCETRVLIDNIYCSIPCSNRDKVTNEEYLKNLSIGKSNYFKTAPQEELDAFFKKVSLGLKRYNSEHGEEKRAKSIEKWGYSDPNSHPDVQAKAKKTKLEKYGNENYVNIEQRILTNQAKYGGNGPMCCPSIIKKMEDTCFANHGVRNIMQSGMTFSEYNWKEYTLPSGKIIKYQGYEDKLLNELLLQYSEDEILTSRKDMPEIWYTGLDNKLHRYFPDAYIPSTNTIYEVKSNYTLEKYKEINLLKFQAVKDAGFNFELKIY